MLNVTSTLKTTKSSKIKQKCINDISQKSSSVENATLGLTSNSYRKLLIH